MHCLQTQSRRRGHVLATVVDEDDLVGPGPETSQGTVIAFRIGLGRLKLTAEYKMPETSGYRQLADCFGELVGRVR